LISSTTQFLREVDETLRVIGLDGAVVGVSGGIDSVAAALLIQEALGTDRVCKVVVDYGVFQDDLPSITEAKQIALTLGGPVEWVSIADLVVLHSRSSGSGDSWFFDLNLQTRLIQNAIFQVADRRKAWVASTIDRSERLLGRYTEFFYGHGEPLADLYKTEVYDLAQYLGAPQPALARRPGCESWMWDDDLFGTTYDVIDPVLYLLTEVGLSPEEISREHGIDLEWVRRLNLRMVQQQSRISTRRLLGLRPKLAGKAPVLKGRSTSGGHGTTG
jgi:NAD+ synthase